jgi:hypothetical protein
MAKSKVAEDFRTLAEDLIAEEVQLRQTNKSKRSLLDRALIRLDQRSHSLFWVMTMIPAKKSASRHGCNLRLYR